MRAALPRIDLAVRTDGDGQYRWEEESRGQAPQPPLRLDGEALALQECAHALRCRPVEGLAEHARTRPECRANDLVRRVDERDQRAPARHEHAEELGDGGRPIGEPVEGFGRHDRVKARGAEGEVERVALHPREVRRMAGGVPEHAVREVAADDLRAVELAFEPCREAPGATPDVENAACPQGAQHVYHRILDRAVGQALDERLVVEIRPCIEEPSRRPAHRHRRSVEPHTGSPRCVASVAMGHPVALAERAGRVTYGFLGATAASSRSTVTVSPGATVTWRWLLPRSSCHTAIVWVPGGTSSSTNPPLWSVTAW